MEVVSLKECPACGGNDFESLPVPGNWIGSEVFQSQRERIGLSRCAHCSFVFTNPRPSSRLLGAFYGGAAAYSCHKLSSSNAVRKRAEFTLSLFEKYSTSSGRRFLDYGCGGGWLLRFGKKRGWSGVGFDVGKPAREICQRQGLEIVGNLDMLRTGSFDFIILSHVFEHLEDPGDILERLRRLLVPDGRLLIEVPNARSLRAILSLPVFSRRLKFDERYRAFPIHLFYFSQGTLKLLLERNGLEVLATETYGVGLDELIMVPDDHEEPYADPPMTVGKSDEPSDARAGQKVRRAAKEVVRKVLFATGLGENLLAVSRSL